MKPEEMQKKIKELEQQVAEIKGYTTSLGGSLEFKKIVELYAQGKLTQSANARVNNLTIDGNIVHNNAGATIGFFDSTPITQQNHISDPSGGGTVDSEARTAITAALAVLENFGFTKTS